MVHLAHGRDAGGGDELGPKVLADVLDRVDADCVDVELAHEVAHPPVQQRNDLGALGVEVGHVVREPALLGLELVVRVPVGDAEPVEVLGLAKRPVVRAGGELAGHTADVVDGHIDHEEHAARVQRVREVPEVLWRAEVGV